MQLFIKEATELIHLQIGEERIVTTPTHPFWVAGYGFKTAGELTEGEYVENAAGELRQITSVQQELLTEPVTVYNFEVDDWHTYYVSEEEIFVHNMCLATPLKSGSGSYGDGHYPKNPDELVEQRWEETTHPDNHSGNRDFVNPKTGEKIHYDKGVSGANGFKGKDHYHRYNPNSTGNSDLYLDRYGNSTPKGSKLSHILPK